MQAQMKYNRFVCITLTISMLVLWIFCGEVYTESSFFNASNLTSDCVTMFSDTSLTQSCRFKHRCPDTGR